MLHVTPEAKSELHGMLMRALEQRPSSDPTDVSFRLVPSDPPETKGQGDGGGGSTRLGVTLDTPREGDEIVEHDGRSVLIVDASTSQLVENLTLDVFDTPEGTRIGLRE